MIHALLFLWYEYTDNIKKRITLHLAFAINDRHILLAQHKQLLDAAKWS